MGKYGFITEAAQKAADDIIDILSKASDALVDENNIQGQVLREKAKLFVDAYQVLDAAVNEYNTIASKYMTQLTETQKRTGIAKIRINTIKAYQSGALSLDDSGREAMEQLLNIKKEAEAQRQKLRVLEGKQRIIDKLLLTAEQARNEFQNALLDLVNRRIEYLYVVKGKKGVVDIRLLGNAKEFSEKYLYTDFASLSHGGRATARVKTIKDSDGKHFTLIDKALEIIGTQLTAFYDELSRRMEIAQDKGTNLLMWKIGGEWNKVEISSLGDLAETYANILVTFSTRLMNNSNLKNPIDVMPDFLKPNHGNWDERIDDFVRGWLHQVDNAPGFLSEDIEGGVDINGKTIYYGVKSNGASAAGMETVYKFALRIKDFEAKMDLEEKQYWARQFSATTIGPKRNQIVQLIESELADLESILDQIGRIR